MLGGGLGVHFGTVGPIARHLGADFSVGLGTAGLVATAALLTHALSQLPAARPIVRHGPERVLRFALAGAGLASIAAAAAPSLALLIAARLVVGCATGPIFVSALEGCRSTAGARGAGAFGGGATLGVAAGVLIAGLTEDAGLSWRWPLAIAGAITLAAIPLARFPDAGRPAVAQVHGIADVVRDPGIWRASLLHVASFGSMLVVAAWIVAYLEGRGVDTAIAASAGFALLGIGVIGRPLGGIIAHGRTAQIPAVGGSLLAAVGLAALALSVHPAVLVPALLVAGVGLSLPFAAAMQAAAARRPERSAAATALVNMLAVAFAVVATPLAGVDIDRHGGRLSFAALAALALAAAVVARR